MAKNHSYPVRQQRFLARTLCAIELFTFTQPSFDDQSQSKYGYTERCTVLFYFHKPGGACIKCPITN